MDNPGSYFFHNDQDFVEYFRLSSKLALCILLHQLSASGMRLKDEIKIFGHSRSYLSLQLTLNKILEYATEVEKSVYYSGHKKAHGFQFQSIMTPDGIMSSLYRIYTGPSAYWQAFGILGLYQSSIPGAVLSCTEEAANVLMSSARISVEWEFGLNVNLWGINNYKKGSKIMSSPVTTYYLVSTLPTNIYTCFKGRNIVSYKFNCPSPSLEDYIHSICY
ncbi:hypothetical protein L873DRAFT_1828123 [Choiromyces venosus 120613-1]|uniref:Uncharacterized protein n=1 Tax=Choiromyces venosus 120613-1 TaxID=1336337 RepID=A0A3N4JLP5_9PEZI|nr:hypothetical protein L873DRAFT_1828123 [Choiromyces venosus 120613-1]